METTSTDPATKYREARESIVENLRTEVEGLVSEAMLSIARHEEEAAEVLATYRSEVEELAEVRRELADARADVTSLPGAAYRANMDSDSLLEEDLRGRYLDARERIPGLERREWELKSKLDAQVKGTGRLAPENAVRSDAGGPARRTASHADENLRKRLLAELPGVVEDATAGLKRRRAGMSGGGSPDPKGMSVAEIETRHSH